MQTSTIRPLLLGLIFPVLSACSGDMWLSAPEKLNKAFPPVTEVRVAEENLRSLLKEDAPALADFEKRYSPRLVLRALTCSQGVTVGRFDGIEKVKTYAVDRSCLAEQDTALMEYLGIRQIGYRMAQPALRPMKPLGQPITVPSGGTADFYLGFAASAAGVAVLPGMSGEGMSIELPGGKKIAAIRTVPGVNQAVVLSPNGRVAALAGSNNSTRFVDTESGSTLWETSAIRNFQVFLPEVNAGLAADAKTGALTLVDFAAGTLSAHPIALPYPTWAIPLSTAPSRVLIGSKNTFTVLEHVRRDVVDGTSVREYRPRQGNGYISGIPLLMREGKTLVFHSARELMSLDLESGKETSWSTADYFSSRYAKMSETTLLIDTTERMGERSSTVLFDIVNATIAPVTSFEPGYGHLTQLAGRTGFFRRSAPGLAFGDAVTTAAPVALATVLEKYNLERQMARLQQASLDDTPRSGETLSELPSSPAFNIAFDGGIPRVPRAAAAPAAGADAGMTALARTGKVEAVGVYQGGSSARTASHQMGNVTVRIRRGKPILLVLSSYEPVRWNLVPEPGANLLGVMVSAYYQSEVVGAGRARVLMTGSKYAYELAGENYRALVQQTMQYAGKGIDTFQGKYEGTSFTVGE